MIGSAVARLTSDDDDLAGLNRGLFWLPDAAATDGRGATTLDRDVGTLQYSGDGVALLPRDDDRLVAGTVSDSDHWARGGGLGILGLLVFGSGHTDNLLQILEKSR